MIEGGKELAQEAQQAEELKQALVDAERYREEAEKPGSSDPGYLEAAGDVLVGALEVAAELVALPFTMLE
jgi:hypothetical protein